MIERKFSFQVVREESELKNLRNQDIENIKIVLENMGKKYYSILDIGRSLGFKVYEDAKIVQSSELIRGTARNLGIATAGERKPNFSLEDAQKIAVELASGKSEEISQKEIGVIENSANQINNENQEFSFKEKKIILSGFTSAEMNMLRIFAETAGENPISGPLLAEKMYGNEIEPKIARNRAYAVLHNLRKKLKEHNLFIATKETRVGKNRGNRTVAYHLIDKSDSVKMDNLEKKLVESEIPAKEDIFVAKRETENWDFRNQGIAALTLTEFSDKKKEPDLDSSPLEDGEIYVIIQCLLAAENKELFTTLSVNMEPLDTEEIRRLFNRVRVKLGKNGICKTDFMKENISSARIKLKSFAKSPEKYYRLCDKKSAQLLLDCLDPVKVNNHFLDELFIKQVADFQKTMARTEV